MKALSSLRYLNKQTLTSATKSNNSTETKSTGMNKPRKKLLRNRTLDIIPLHLLLTLRTQDTRRENARLNLRLDPFFQAFLARVSHVLARRGRVAVGELRGDAADQARLAFVALGLGFAALGGGGRHDWWVWFEVDVRFWAEVVEGWWLGGLRFEAGA